MAQAPAGKVDLAADFVGYSDGAFYANYVGGLFQMEGGERRRRIEALPELVAWAGELGRGGEIALNGGALAASVVLIVILLLLAVAAFEEQELSTGGEGRVRQALRSWSWSPVAFFRARFDAQQHLPLHEEMDGLCRQSDKSLPHGQLRNHPGPDE